MFWTSHSLRKTAVALVQAHRSSLCLSLKSKLSPPLVARGLSTYVVFVGSKASSLLSGILFHLAVVPAIWIGVRGSLAFYSGLLLCLSSGQIPLHRRGHLLPPGLSFCFFFDVIQMAVSSPLQQFPRRFECLSYTVDIDLASTNKVKPVGSFFFSSSPFLVGTPAYSRSSSRFYGWPFHCFSCMKKEEK
jgi:hypothetical protein